MLSWLPLDCVVALGNRVVPAPRAPDSEWLPQPLPPGAGASGIEHPRAIRRHGLLSASVVDLHGSCEARACSVAGFAGVR